MAINTFAEAITGVRQWVQTCCADYTHGFDGFIPDRPRDGSTQYPLVAVLPDTANVSINTRELGSYSTLALRIFLGRKADEETTAGYGSCVGRLLTDVETLMLDLASRRQKVGGRMISNVSWSLADDQPKPHFLIRISITIALPPLFSGDEYLT